nr:DUF3450 family protein [uncultured Pseudodesulfovibrio sp.]
MRFIIAFFTLLCLALPVHAQTETTPRSQEAVAQPQAKKWKQTVNEVSALRDRTKANADQTMRDIADEKHTLQQELEALRSENDRRNANYQSWLQQFERKADQKQMLETALDSQKDSMRLIEGTVRTSAKQMRKRALNSPVTAERPARLQELEALLDTNHFPGLESIQALTEMWFREFTASGEVRSTRTICIAPDGSERQGIVTRLGTLGAFFLDDDGMTAFLQPSVSGKLEMVPGDFNDAVDGAKEFVANQRIDAPLDFSGGEVFKRFGDTSGFLTSILNGGLLVWPILLVGFIGFVLAGERLFSLSRIRTCPDCQMGKAMEWAVKGDLKRCASCLGTKGNTPTCRVLKHVVLHSGGTLVSMEKGLQESILHELPKLERFLPTINILAAVAPLLGLLGTVTGMIGTFQVITIFGTGDARMMSGGISEALVTTQLGLAVAVPLTLMHHFLERKVDCMVADMEEKGTTLVSRIVATGKGD